uniref:Papilin-like protein n=1 Tax=Callorhinchus milii TaxID=7868 RepID=K4GI31_CALMI|nr:papilin-like protein [Callorhinchus milii]
MKNFNTAGLSLGLIAVYLTFFTSAQKLPECNLPKDEGQQGNNPTIRFYYDKNTDTCKPFSYKGTGGNGNNSLTDKPCMRNCSMRGNEIYPSDDRACMLPMEKGDCKGHILLYYFNSTKKKCSSFLYGGCGGNGNRFFLQQLCKTVCASKIDQLAGEDDEPAGNEALAIGLGMGFALVAVLVVAGVIFFLQRKKLREKAPKTIHEKPLTDGIEMK